MAGVWWMIRRRQSLSKPARPQPRPNTKVELPVELPSTLKSDSPPTFDFELLVDDRQGHQRRLSVTAVSDEHASNQVLTDLYLESPRARWFVVECIRKNANANQIQKNATLSGSAELGSFGASHTTHVPPTIFPNPLSRSCTLPMIVPRWVRRS